MDWSVKAYLKASLVWLGLGVSLGVAMAARPSWTVYRTAHLHMNLVGFVTMMIFGVAYHVIPRFTGHPLHSRRLSVAQWWVANAGLTLFVTGFALLPHMAFGATARAVVATGGALTAAAAYIFVYNIWRTIDGKAANKIGKQTAARPDVQAVLRRPSAT